MYYYKFYGKRVQSDWELRQLLPQTEEEMAMPQEITIKEGKVPDSTRREKECFSEIKSPEAHFGNYTMYMYITNGDTILYEIKDPKNISSVNAYLTGWGISILFYQRGVIGIHCSCVANENGAVIISGASGAGKSTTTAHFLEKGYRLMADDLAMVEVREDGVYACPAFPFQKLCRDAALDNGYDLSELIYINEQKDKFLVPYQGNFSTEPVKLRCMLMLYRTNEEEVGFMPITGIDRLHHTIASMFLARLMSKKEAYAPELGAQCLKISAGVPEMYALYRPAEKDTKKEILELIDEKIL